MYTVKAFNFHCKYTVKAFNFHFEYTVKASTLPHHRNLAHLLPDPWLLWGNMLQKMSGTKFTDLHFSRNSIPFIFCTTCSMIASFLLNEKVKNSSRRAKLKASTISNQQLQSDWSFIISLRCKQWSCSSLLPTITYYWTVPLILDHSYLLGNWTNSKIAETNALEPLKSWHLCISNFELANLPSRYEWSKIRGTVQE